MKLSRSRAATTAGSSRPAAAKSGGKSLSQCRATCLPDSRTSGGLHEKLEIAENHTLRRTVCGMIVVFALNPAKAGDLVFEMLKVAGCVSSEAFGLAGGEIHTCRSACPLSLQNVNIYTSWCAGPFIVGGSLWLVVEQNQRNVLYMTLKIVSPSRAAMESFSSRAMIY